jgi:pyruvate kinase
MLESMIENPRPTRSEVSDVANAVYDGTDAVMLSGESAMGKYPVEAVSMMARIVSETERHIKEDHLSETRIRTAHLSIAETICEATAHASDDLDLRGIALFTESGATARQLSKYHPSAPIFALSPIEITINRLCLLWGTTPVRCPKVNTTEALVDCAESLLEQHGYVRPREVIGIVAGTRTKSGSTNFLRLHVMGEHNLEGVRFFAQHEAEPEPVKIHTSATPTHKVAAKPAVAAEKPAKVARVAKATPAAKPGRKPGRKAAK